MAPASPHPRRLEALDGLRAVAALSVLAYHAWLYTLPQVAAANRDSTADYVWHELRLGLVLFFVLSGFLLYGGWVAAARDPAREPSMRAFWLRRAARILPAYWIAIAVSAAALWSLDGTPGVRLPAASDLWLFAVFGQNFTEGTLLKLNPPTWTLAVEATFYLALPLLAWVALRARRAGGLVVVPLLFLAGGVLYNRAIATTSADLPLTVTKILPAFAPYFAVGMLAAVVAHGRSLPRSTVGLLLLAGGALVVADGAWAADAATRGSHDLALKIWRDLPGATGFALIILAAAAGAAPLRALVAKPVVWLGEVSYGIYLWHVPVMLVLRANGLLPASPVLATVVALAPTLLLAAASWRWVEQPAQALARDRARRWQRARSGTPAQAQAAAAVRA